MSSNFPRKVLIVDSDQMAAKFIENQLIKHNIGVVTSNLASSSLYLFNTHLIDCVVASFDLNEFSGLVLFQKLRKLDQELGRAFISVLTVGKNFSNQNQALLEELGDVHALQKPVKEPQLMAVLQKKQAERVRHQASLEIVQKVNTHMRKGRMDNGLGLFKENMQMFGAKGPKMFADMLENVEQLEEALAIHMQREEQSPDDLSVINDLGRMHLKMGNFKEAQGYFERADKQAPQNIQRMNDMATMYLHLNNPDKTVEKYKEILGISPEEPDLKFNMLQSLKIHGFSKQAQSFCEAVAKPLELIRYYNNKGVLLAKNDKYDEAIAEYQNAVDFFPDFADIYRIYFNMALAYMKIADQKNKVQELLVKCLDANPNFDKAKIYLGRI